MRALPALLLLVLAAVLCAQLAPPPAQGPAGLALLAPAGAEKINAAVRAADDERVAATVAADRTRLDAVLSEGLHYAHSNGWVDSKSSFIDAVTSGRLAYHGVEYRRRDFLIASDGIVLMTGTARLLAGAEGRRAEIDVNFLAVWRQEAGRWRFLAWQSNRLPAPTAP